LWLSLRLHLLKEKKLFGEYSYVNNLYKEHVFQYKLIKTSIKRFPHNYAIIDLYNKIFDFPYSYKVMAITFKQ
jgi:hypothetical protein